MIISLFVLSSSISAQVNIDELDVSKVFSKPTDKNKYGSFKSQKVKGKISGMGAFLFKNGSLYFGDFIEKEFHGKGSLISVDSISNCPNCMVYVGRFKHGLKSGKGRCYNANGELIYEGKFSDDRPVDSYPNIDLKIGSAHYFSEFVNDDYHFIGEFEGEVPAGEGFLIFNNGDIFISPFLDGNQDGIGVYVQSDGNWICEKNDKGIVTPISSSKEYETLRSHAKAIFREALGVSLGYFAGAAQKGAELSTQISNLSSKDETNSSSDYSSETDSGSNNYSSDKKYNLSEQQSYNKDKSTYHKYDGMLSKAFAGNIEASASEIKNWQSKMKQLREKWEAKGKDFPHFPNEDR
ncbi:MAG: hypothetical protein ACI304_00300 [Lepagella sp.]